jgi:hypothetical protein
MIQFRLSNDAQRYYLFDLMLGWRAATISRGNLASGTLQKLSVVNFPVEHAREYDVLIAARGASITTYIDGKLINQVTDFEHDNGGVALCVWQSKTSFRDPRVRLLH